MYLHFTPKIIQWLYPELLWHFPRDQKKIYLTFDDGPVPEATDFVLETLEAYNAKATFFCVGENVQKHTSIFNRVVDRGHQIGNHTHNHLNGRKVKNSNYMDNVAKCEEVFSDHLENPVKLFRPPYGRIRNSQIRQLTPKQKIVMWDVLSGDFDLSLPKEVCLSKSISHTKNGSVIVFHDSLKTITTLRYVLPKYLEHFENLGYSFDVI